ncbi:MAG: transposase [Tepidisphaeraceae bacterium]
MCPGNNESAGKRRSGRTRSANPWLKAALTQSAWAAGRTKLSYFSVHKSRIAKRRGQKRAIIAVAHSLLVVTYHLLKGAARYCDLGVDHFERIKPERQARSLVHRLNKLGYRVTIDREAA